ncbi:MAG: uroporphyrinogen-III synthase [Planctomycetota bacterium]|jgi:uroporphyrinogen-III synthase
MKILFTGLDPTSFATLGDIIHRPALQLVPDEEGHRQLPDIIEKLKRGDFNQVVFTDRAAVEPFIKAVKRHNRDATILEGCWTAAAGPGTASRMTGSGIRVDAVPSKPGIQGVLSLIDSMDENRILLIKGSHFPIGLMEAIEERGWSATLLSLCKIVTHPDLGSPLPEYDVIYFVSPSGVRNYWRVYGDEAFKKEIWCLGDMVLSELSELGAKGKIIDPYKKIPG